MMDDWLAKKALLVTGKGGVGKTLTAALLAREAANAGKRVCLMQCSIEDQIGPLFGTALIRHVMTPLMPGLDCINIDLDLNFRDFIVHQMGFEKVFEQIFNQKLVRSFLGIIPGLRELALIGRVYHFAVLEKDPYDLVIFDGFSSGHFLQLMTTPRAIFDSGIIGTILNVTKRIDEFFRDSALCGTIVVTHPEFLPLSECVDLVRELRERSPSAVCGVVFNRFPDDPAKGQGKTSRAKIADPAFEYVTSRFKRAQDLTREAVASLKDKIQSGEKENFRTMQCIDCGAVPEPLDAKHIEQLELRVCEFVVGS